MEKKERGKEKYEKPKEKKRLFKPEMKKCQQLNKVIGTCGCVYGACSGGGSV